MCLHNYHCHNDDLLTTVILRKLQYFDNSVMITKLNNWRDVTIMMTMFLHKDSTV